MRRALIIALVLVAGCGEASGLRIEDARPPAAPPTTATPPGGAAVGTIPVPGITAAAWWQDALWLLADDARRGIVMRRLSLENAEAHRPPGAGIRVALLVRSAGGRVLAVGERGVWLSGDGRSVVQVDPRSGAVLATIPTPGAVVALQELNGTTWGVDNHPAALQAVAPAGGATPLPGRPVAITRFAGSLWVAGSDGSVTRVSGDGRRVLGTTDVHLTPRSRPTQITAYRDRVWVFVGDGVVALDPATGRRVLARALPGVTTGTFAAGARAVWVVGAPNAAADAALIRIDPANGHEVGARLALHTPATGILTGGGAVWIVTPSSVLRVVPADEP